MVKDINKYEASSSSNPRFFKILNNKLLFVAENKVSGYSLFATDGSKHNTFKLSDINSTSFQLIGDKAYFIKYSTIEDKHELWQTDGTNNNTIKIFQFNDLQVPQNFIKVDDEIFFTILTSNGNELWKTNGTESGTILIKIFSWLNSGSPEPLDFIDVNGTLFFTIKDDSHGRELWKSDGTEAGTTIVKDINFGNNSSIIENMYNLNGILYFRVDDSIHGIELWKSDGTEIGTKIVKDLVPGIGSSFPSSLESINGILYFRSFDGAYEWLTKSDGTEEGTYIFTYKCSFPSGINNINNTLYFSGGTNQNGFELWKSDGTDLGTVLIKDIVPGSKFSQPFGISKIENGFYFICTNANNGKDVWVSDGSEIGTKKVTNFNSPESGFNYNLDSKIPLFIEFNNFIYFSNDNLINGTELWKTNGVPSESSMVIDLDRSTNASFIRNVMNFKNELYFVASAAPVKAGLYKSDGTDTGTNLIKVINSNATDFGPYDFVSNSNYLFFHNNVNEIYRTDGTELGTILLKNNLVKSKLVNFNNSIYFFVDNGLNSELWKTDGLIENTILIKSFPTNQYISSLLPIGNILYFTFNDGQNGNELWKTDGTNLGTSLVKDINLGLASSSPKSFFEFNNILFFLANDGLHGEELWRSDGTEMGTFLLKDFWNSTTPSKLKNYFIFKNKLLFLNVGPTHYIDDNFVYETDGTIEGTKAIFGSNNLGLLAISNFTVYNNKLYFTATDLVTGVELFVSDGTVQGTHIVKDFTPTGLVSSGVRNLIVYDGSLYFMTSINFGQLWKTDGTEAGTQKIKDIGGGNIIISNGYMYFGGSNYYYNNLPNLGIWKSNGTTVGTKFLKAFSSIDNGSSIKNLIDINDKLYFTTDYYSSNATYLDELWSLGSCTENNKIIVDSESSYSYNVEMQSNTYKYCLCDLNNNLISTIEFANMTQPLENIKANLWIENEQPIGFLKRHYQLKGTLNSGQILNKITFYYTQEEFNSLNQRISKKLPQFPADYNGISNLLIKKISGESSNNFGLPNSYNGEISSINPDDNQIIWETEKNRWAVSINIDSFGGFFMGNGVENLCPIGTIVQSQKSGNWDDISVWSCGQIPLPSDNVEIQAGHIITVNSTQTVKSIKLQGTINIEANSTIQINP